MARGGVTQDRLRLGALRRHALEHPLSRADVNLDRAFFRDDPLRMVRIGLTVNR